MSKQATKEDEKKIFMVLGILFCLGALAALSYGVKTVFDSRAILQWPVTQGSVIKSDTRWQRGTDGGSSTLIADVKYNYEVKGRRYQSDRISLGQFGSNDPDHARQQASQYPLGSLVDVHYDPDNHSQAVLELGWGWINAIAFVVGIIAFIAGIFLIRQSLRIRI